MVDVRTRDNKRHGKMRVDDLAEHLKTLEPEKSQSYKNMYAKAWDPANFPKDEEMKQEKSGASASVKVVSTAKFDELDQRLKAQGSVWFSGQNNPSAADRESLEAVMKSGAQVDPKVHPYLFGWYSLASKFSDKVKASWK